MASNSWPWPVQALASHGWPRPTMAGHGCPWPAVVMADHGHVLAGLCPGLGLGPGFLGIAGNS